jgi:hypothetical protein
MLFTHLMHGVSDHEIAQGVEFALFPVSHSRSHIREQGTEALYPGLRDGLNCRGWCVLRSASVSVVEAVSIQVGTDEECFSAGHGGFPSCRIAVGNLSSRCSKFTASQKPASGCDS